MQTKITGAKMYKFCFLTHGYSSFLFLKSLALLLVTDRKGKVIFSYAFVCPHGEGYPDPLPPSRQILPYPSSRQTPQLVGRPPSVLTSSGSHCSSRYTSYWNAFLFLPFWFKCNKLDKKILF